jgi:hypothetical protein
MFVGVAKRDYTTEEEKEQIKNRCLALSIH